MKDKSIKVKSILLLIILMFLVAPFFQAKFHIVKLTPLKGAITEPENKYINIKDWFSGTYQEQKEKYLNESFGFRSLFIRINNQIAFSLFNKAKANGVIIGKHNYLYEENYIKAYYGSDFIGADSITHRMERLKFIEDTLITLQKDLILVFAPGKGSFYPEYIPNKFKIKKSTTNYELHVKLAEEMGLKFIDFNKYFIEHKYTSKYPLYPQYGIHWSYYGMCLAADSIVRYIEKVRHIDMPNFYWNDVDLGAPRETDYDIADGMNIKFKLKSFKMAYPNVQYESDSGKVKVSALVISDSFYWGMFSSGIFARSFSSNHFWFYNKQVYTAGVDSESETSLLDLKEEIAKHDVIIIMATDATLPGFGWGFIENTYNLFKGTKDMAAFDAVFQTKITNARNYIKTDENWMEHIEKKAILNNISVDSMITLDAIWQIKHEK